MVNSQALTCLGKNLASDVVWVLAGIVKFPLKLA